MLRLLSLARRIPRNWDPLLSRPSVAVMPLGNLTGDPGLEYFADGLAEELTHELARFRGLRVIASHSTFPMKEVKAGAGVRNQRLGARFLVEGGVRKEEEIIKISVRLVDTMTGVQIWGEQYRRKLTVSRSSCKLDH
jgi:adenylate cyclase